MMSPWKDARSVPMAASGMGFDMVATLRQSHGDAQWSTDCRQPEVVRNPRSMGPFRHGACLAFVAGALSVFSCGGRAIDGPGADGGAGDAFVGGGCAPL